MTFDDQVPINDIPKKNHASLEPGYAAEDDARARTRLRVKARVVGGLLGFALAWPIAAGVGSVLTPPSVAVPINVATPAAILGGITVGWFIGRGNIALRLKNAKMVLIAYLGLLIGFAMLVVFFAENA